jgi:large conductance mechanosensitive channel
VSLLSDFKSFAFKGNVLDLAVGVIIGGAFGKIVSAMVADLIMPAVSLVLPSGNWRESGFVIKHAANPKDDVIFKYGDFAGNLLDFLIVSFVLFLFVSKLVKGAEARFGPKAGPATKECPRCLETIPFKATRCKACTSELS